VRFSAWMDPGNPASLASFEAHAGLLGRVYPLYYLAAPGGGVQRRPDAGAELRERVRAAAKAAGCEVWPLIGNQALPGGAFDPGLLAGMLGDGGARRAHIEALLALVKADGAAGADLDYEALPASLKDGFSAFVAEAAQAFHREGLKLGAALHAKSAEPGCWDGACSHDYAALGAVCDRVQVMGYDFHWAEGEAGAVSPPRWCGEVLDHALKTIPARALEWGMPLYGYAWAGGPRAETLHWANWCALLDAHRPERRDPETGELRLQAAGIEAWMNDSLSVSAKLWEARRRGVEEGVFWVLGAEDPRLWALLETLPD